MKILFTVVILYSQVSLTADFCSMIKSQKNVTTEVVQNALITFANNKTIAKQADETLAKLLSAKSKIIINWLSKPENQNISEESIAKNWRLYYAKNIILAQYPASDSDTNSQIEKLTESLERKITPQVFKTKLEKIFKQSKQAAVATLKNYHLKASDELIKKVESIELYWPNLKSAKSTDQITPLDFIEWGIAYNPLTNKINMGLESANYPNDETYLAVFAHEIGHSFDSCRWGAFFTGPWPFEKVGECLRSDKSVKALKRDDSKIDDFVKSGKLTTDLALALKQNPTCNKTAYPQAGLQADQLPESFADWFSSEVMANIKKLDLKKLRIDLCSDKKLSDGSSYPTNNDRLFKIYQAHPKLNLNAKSDGYCRL